MDGTGGAYQGHSAPQSLQNPETPLATSHAAEKEEGRQRGKYAELFRQHRHETITYCLVFWAFGMCVALLGPTLLDLGCKTSNMFSTMSWAFFAQSLCTLVGSATGGILVQRYGTHPVLLAACSMLGLTLVVIGWCERLLLLALVLGLMGFFMGTIDTVANLSMLELYGTNVAPFMQALHFFYGLGAFLSPLISMPFLLSHGCGSSFSATASTGTLLSTVPSLPATLSPSASWTDLAGNYTLRAATPHPISRIQYAFWIMALLQIPVIVMVASLVTKQIQSQQKKVEQVSEDYAMVDRGLKLSPFPAEVLRSPQCEQAVTQERPFVTPQQATLLTTLTAMLLFLYDGLQASYGGYVYSYAVKSLAGLTVPKAAYLNACFWGTFAFGRLISIWLATKLAPSFMLFCNISGCLSAMILMMTMPHDTNALYLGTCIFGMFLSSIYPTSISLADTYIQLTSPVTTIIVVAAAAGEMSMPVLVGHEFEIIGPVSFLATGLAVTCISVLVYAAIYITGSSITRQTATPGMFGTLTSCIPHPSGRGDQGETSEDSGLMRHHVKYYSRMRSDASDSSLAGHQQDQVEIPDQEQVLGYQMQQTSSFS